MYNSIPEVFRDIFEIAALCILCQKISVHLAPPPFPSPHLTHSFQMSSGPYTSFILTPSFSEQREGGHRQGRSERGGEGGKERGGERGKEGGGDRGGDKGG